MDRLFNLDAQLLFDTAVTAVNIFILFTFLSYMFSDPLRKLLRDRQERIQNEINTAAKDKADALKLKNDYEAKLMDIRKEAEVILSDARKKAMQNENRIVSEAKEEAVRIRERANVEIELEKKKAADDMKQEMIQIASLMAGKVVEASMDATKQEALIQKTLEEMGDQVWQS